MAYCFTVFLNMKTIFLILLTIQKFEKVKIF